MFPARCLLCIVVIGVCSITGKATPELQFVCEDASGTITIPRVNITEIKDIYAIGKTSSAKGPCTVTNTSEKFTIAGCRLDNPVTIYTMVVPILGTSGNIFVIGGKASQVYDLECFKETMVGDNTKLLSVIQVARQWNITAQNNDAVSEFSVYPEMSIWKDENTPAPQVIHAGDKLTVVISGPAGPAYRVNKCMAYTPGHKDTSIDLMGESKTVYDTLMTNFDQSFTPSSQLDTKCYGKFCMKSTLYAFHFKEENIVTLECTIEACKDTSGDCSPDKSFTARPTTLPTTTTARHARRRRESKSNRHLLSSTIVVLDRLGSDESQKINNGNTQELSIFIAGTLAIFWGSSGFV